MEPTFDFSNDDTTSEFDLQAESRLRHMFDALRAHPSFKSGDGGLAGSWHNDTVSVDASSDPQTGAQTFTVRRGGSTARSVEALTVVGQQVFFTVRRTEDGWTVEYPFGLPVADPENRVVRAWQPGMASPNESVMPLAQFRMRANTILADLQSGISRLSASQSGSSAGGPVVTQG